MHHQEIEKGKIVSDFWMCSDCYYSETTCDHCGKSVMSCLAKMDRVHNEVLCLDCAKIAGIIENKGFSRVI